MKEILQTILVVFVVPLALLWGGAAAYDNFSCKTKAGVMQKPATWGPVQGCMIQVKGEWVPIERYRVID